MNEYRKFAIYLAAFVVMFKTSLYFSDVLSIDPTSDIANVMFFASGLMAFVFAMTTLFACFTIVRGPRKTLQIVDRKSLRPA